MTIQKVPDAKSEYKLKNASNKLFSNFQLLPFVHINLFI